MQHLKKEPKHTFFYFINPLLLSAHVKAVGVYRMRDFLTKSFFVKIHDLADMLTAASVAAENRR